MMMMMSCRRFSEIIVDANAESDEMMTAVSGVVPFFVFDDDDNCDYEEDKYCIQSWEIICCN